MITFLIALVLVLVAVDLAVRFIVDPLISESRKKAKFAKTSVSRFDPSFKLATETMFDGGKEHKEENQSESNKEADKN